MERTDTTPDENSETGEILGKLGKLEGTTEAILSLLQGHTERLNDHSSQLHLIEKQQITIPQEYIDQLSELNKRLQEVEKRQSWFMGILYVLGGAIVFADTWILSHFSG